MFTPIFVREAARSLHSSDLRYAGSSGEVRGSVKDGEFGGVESFPEEKFRTVGRASMITCRFKTPGDDQESQKCSEDEDSCGLSDAPLRVNNAQEQELQLHLHRIPAG
jgi:hypothetical protein